MKQYFGFMDETGVLSNDPQQRFFSLGLMMLENTSKLFEDVKKLKDKYGKNSTFEFKFNGITQDSHLPIHTELVDICLSHPEFYFTAIVLDKNNANHATPHSTWEYQIEMARTHVQRNVNGKDRIAVIADYLTKPNSSTKYFEDELNRLHKVFNATMLESDASVFVQIVDILIGAIVYRYKIEEGLVRDTTPKGKLVKYIEKKLDDGLTSYDKTSGNFKHKKNLIGGFTIFEPFYFSVYEKRK